MADAVLAELPSLQIRSRLREIRGGFPVVESCPEYGLQGRITSGIGLGLILLSSIWACETWQFARTAQRVNGVVVGEESWKGKHGTKTVLLVEYRAGGTMHSTRADGDGAKRGDALAILVSPTDPADCRRPEGLYDWKIGMVLLGFALVLQGLFWRPGI